MGIFREYDIRGVVEKDLTPEVVNRIGRAYGTMARERGVRTISVGRDGRLTSRRLSQELIAGLTDSGVNVIDVGLCATPLLYFSLYHLPVDGGIMITGSHNAAEYNGFKLCIGKEALHGVDILQLQTVFEGGVFSSGEGRKEQRSIILDYLNFLRDQFMHIPQDHGLHVVIDCGNGAASLVAKDVLEQLGCRVTGLYCDLDGNFPHHHPDPTVMENLQDLMRQVKERKADVGIGYDGDADRIGVIDDTGHILWGDRLLLLFAREVLLENPGSTFISEVKASQVLYDDIQRRGGQAIMWKTGHSVMKAKMKQEKALLAGEMSGHLFFADRYFGYDDAMYASCRLVEILVKYKKPLSTLLADVPSTIVTPEIRVDCSDDQKFRLVDRVIGKLTEVRDRQASSKISPIIRDMITIDGVRIIFDEGWGLIRASNTQPALVLRFEATSHAQLKIIQGFLNEQLAIVQREMML
ncbi:MAG: phosphomannomutase/phosphoglucomutase [Nitrospirales bacterium]|nr:phosphomannomutase/phosphoglucomutase [Nitrospirales bacterium]